MGFDLAGYYRVFFEQQNPLNTVPNLSPNNIFTDPAFGDSYITLDRLEDTQSHGQAAAVFEAVTDFEALFTNPQIEDDLWEVMQPQAEIMGLPANKRDLLDAYAAVMQGFLVNTHEIIGRDDFYVHGLTLTVDWSPDLRAFDRLLGGSGDYLPLVNISLMVRVELDDFNAVSPIAAPPGAMIIPLDGFVPARPTA
jgi:hypothetical protein